MDAKIEALVNVLSTGQWEFSLGFEGLSDEDFWKRPHPNCSQQTNLPGTSLTMNHAARRNRST